MRVELLLEAQEEEPHWDFRQHSQRRLFLAILSRAVSDILDDSNWLVSGKDRQGAKRWMFVEKRADPFSFEGVCNALDLPIIHLRRCVLKAMNNRILANRILKLMRRGCPGT